MTRRADCPGCKSHTVQDRTTGCQLPDGHRGPVDDSPLWHCRNCGHVMARRIRRTKSQRIMDSLR